MQRMHSVLLISSLLPSQRMHSVGHRSMTSCLNVEFAPVSACMGAGVGFELAAHVRFHCVLVDADVVSPGPDDGHVRTGYGSHAAIGASVKLELELVGEGRSVKLVLICIGHLMAGFLGVVAGKLAARHS